MIGALVVIAQLAIVAHGPDSASTCEAFEVSVAVSARGSSRRGVIAPSFSPFDVLRSSRDAASVVRPRGDGSVTAEYRYVLTTDHIGTYTLAPFEARLGNQVIRSRPCRSPCTRPGARRCRRSSRARASTRASRSNFRALTLPETVYVGQQANYEVAVFLNETVRDRLRRNPTFFPPDMQSMLAYDLAGARRIRRGGEGGSHCFDALVYQRALFPLMPGRFAIPPAQLVYSLPLSASFFSREETHELRDRQHDHRRRRTADGGTSGRLRRRRRQRPRRARASTRRRRASAIRCVLTVRVIGTGNVKLFPRPAVGVPWATLVKGDERVQRRHDGASNRRVEGIRLAAHAEGRRRARRAADSLRLLQPRHASLRGRVDGQHARARGAGIARLGRHGAHGDAAAAPPAISRRAAHAAARVSGVLGAARARTAAGDHAAPHASVEAPTAPSARTSRRARLGARVRRGGADARRVARAPRVHGGALRAAHARARELHARRRAGARAPSARRVHRHRDASRALSPRARRGGVRGRRRAAGRRRRARRATVSRRGRRGAAARADRHARARA